MQIHRVVFHFLILLLLFAGCQIRQEKISITESEEKTVYCTADPVHSYEVYIPKISSGCADLPVLIILDPHAEGGKALEYFKPGAERHGIILVASNLIQNNYPDYVNALNLLLEDIREKYPVSGRVYLAGFSGAGRMALNYARYFPVTGIISCGALAQASQMQEIPCNILAISGMADFNFIETAQYIFNPEKAPGNLKIEFTSGKHEWPDKPVLEGAMGYLLYTYAGVKECVSQDQIKHFCAWEEAEIGRLTKEDEFLRAGLLARRMADHEYFSRFSDFKSLRDEIELRDGFRLQIDRLKESIRLELSVRNEYSSAMKDMDVDWWQNEIQVLDRRIIREKDPFRKFALMRVKGFLGIITYSLTDNSLKKNDLAEAQRLLGIYKLLEPENPDMFYFRALAAYRQGDSDQARADLIESEKRGFSDPQRLEQDFPEEIRKVLDHGRD